MPVKKVALWTVMTLVCAAGARAQEPEEIPINPEMQRQELLNLEMENARAIKLHNATFFKSAYSEDFSGVSRYGEIVNKAALIREVQELQSEYDSVVSSDVQVKLYRDTAVVLSLRSELGRDKGKKFYNQFRILRVYLNTPKGWKIVSQLETMLAGDVAK